MKNNLIKAVAMGLMLVVAPTVSFADHHKSNESAVNNEHRSEADKARDEARKPIKILDFYGVEEGMTILDLGSGSGYFSTIFSGAVGEEGKVYAQLSQGAYDRSKEALDARYSHAGNVEVLISGMGDLSEIPDNSVDRVFLFLLYHHLNYNAETGEAMPEGTKAIYKEIYRVLKPGGVFGLTEHEAVAGTNREQAAAWHRATSAQSIEDATSQGFELAGEGKMFQNPDDPMNTTWFESLRGKTTRIVHAYKKPGM